MTLGRSPIPALLLGLAALAGSGCAQSDPFLAHRTGVGTLKASLAQLEHDNEQFRKRIAELESQKNELGEELAQEQEANATLATRLNHALARLNKSDSGLIPEEGAGSVTAPVKQPPRKPPFAQISGKPRPTPEASSQDDTGFTLPPPDSPARSGTTSRWDDPGNLKWLPIATGALPGAPRG